MMMMIMRTVTIYLVLTVYWAPESSPDSTVYCLNHHVVPFWGDPWNVQRGQASVGTGSRRGHC